MNIIDYPGMILTKNELWSLYCKLNYKERDIVSFCIKNYANSEEENKKEFVSKFKVVK